MRVNAIYNQQGMPQTRNQCARVPGRKERIFFVYLTGYLMHTLLISIISHVASKVGWCFVI